MNTTNRPCDTWADSLHDFLDGDLSETDGQQLQQHLEACDSCHRELDGLRQLRQRTAALSVDVAPRRDLWPEIAARLAIEPQARETADRSQGWRRWWTKAPAGDTTRTAALAATVALLILTGLAALYLMPTFPRLGPNETGPESAAESVLPDGVGTLPASRNASTSDSDSSYRQVEVEFEQARRQLHTALGQRRDQLSPATLEVVERNLDLIDQAISEIRQALEQDPENPELRHLLTASYQREVQLLKRATQLPQS